MKQLVPAAAALCCALAAPVPAQEVNEIPATPRKPAQPGEALSVADVMEIHRVVRAQLNAFAADDAKGAFELATLEKRMQIGSAEDFLRMIRESYRPIYRYKAVIFEKPDVVAGMTLQKVRVTDAQSRVWLAIFWMQRDEAAGWKIDGCHLLETSNISV